MALAERLSIPLREVPRQRVAAPRVVDGEALTDLVQRYDRTVFNVILGLVHNRQDAEDLAQEVWIKVANNLANLRDQERLLPWLYRISRNCSLTFLSSQRTRSQATAFALDEEEDLMERLPSPASDSPEHQAISEVDRREVWTALMALSESDRQALLLREFQDFSYAEIANTLNISRGNAEVRVFRARLRFRQQFTKQNEGVLARGFFAFPGLALLAKLKAFFGASAATSSVAGSTAATGATSATGGVAAVAGTGLAAQITLGVAAQVAVAVIALSAAAGVVAVAQTELSPADGAPAVDSSPVSAGDAPAVVNMTTNPLPALPLLGEIGEHQAAIVIATAPFEGPRVEGSGPQPVSPPAFVAPEIPVFVPPTVVPPVPDDGGSPAPAVSTVSTGVIPPTEVGANPAPSTATSTNTNTEDGGREGGGRGGPGERGNGGNGPARPNGEGGNANGPAASTRGGEGGARGGEHGGATGSDGHGESSDHQGSGGRAPEPSERGAGH